MGSGDKDLPGEAIEERAGGDPNLPSPVDPKARRRRLFEDLAEVRTSRGRSQSTVGGEMGTSQSSIARLERAAFDARLSTIDRYVEALGLRVQWHLLPVETAADEPVIVVRDEPQR
jgi:predicted transcriptional regulator